MTSAFDQVRALLPKLDAADRRKLGMLLSKFPGRANTNKQVQSDRVEADWLLQGILAELKRRNHPVGHVDWRRVREAAPNYEIASQEVRAFFEDKLPRASRTELQALGGVLARCLAVYLESWNEPPPIALRSLLLNVGSIVEALEDSLPGYLAGGMLPILIGR